MSKMQGFHQVVQSSVIDHQLVLCMHVDDQGVYTVFSLYNYNVKQVENEQVWEPVKWTPGNHAAEHMAAGGDRRIKMSLPVM